MGELLPPIATSLGALGDKTPYYSGNLDCPRMSLAWRPNIQVAANSAKFSEVASGSSTVLGVPVHLPLKTPELPSTSVSLGLRSSLDPYVRLTMLIKSWRCDMPSCKTLAFDTEDGIRDHQAEHFSELCKQWKTYSICPWPKCRSRASNATFESLVMFRKHLRTHLKSKWCHLPDCNYDRPFSTEHDLRRHIRTAHNNDNPLHCPLGSCSQSYFRYDKLEEHVKRAHNTCKCTYDHCGVTILDDQATKDSHLTTCHQEKPIFECALTGCELTTSRFKRDEAVRHLISHHGLSGGYIGSAYSFIRRVEENALGEVKTMTMDSQIRS